MGRDKYKSEEEIAELRKEFKERVDKQIEEIERKHKEGEPYPKGKHPNSLKALRPNYLTTEDKRKGGLKSGEIRRQRKSFKLTLDELLAMPVSVKRIQDMNPELSELLEKMGVSGDAPLFELASYARIVNLLKGDNKAFENVRDTLGEKPVEKAEHSLFSQGIHVVIADEIGDEDLEEDPDLS